MGAWKSNEPLSSMTMDIYTQNLTRQMALLVTN